MKRYVAIALFCVTAACSRQPSPADAPAATAAAPATPAEGVRPVGDEHFQVQPASLTDCTPAVVSVVWDVSNDPSAGAVELWVGREPNEKLFAAGGNKGQAATGAWTRPGEQFALRKAGDRAVLAHAVVGGPHCEQ